jgi:tetratricopeptide (TPR) repeat protein
MKSRLLVRLEADIGSALNSVAADCLRCERAAYLARLGGFAEASREIAAVQQDHARNPNAAVSAWSSFAEAMVSYYSNLGALAIDKMKRSYALSKAVGLQPLQALASAWLAQFSYVRMDVPAMAKFVVEAMVLAGPEDRPARARANLVIAQGYDQGGRYDLARSWYASARYHAANDGDDATLSALMWNMATLRVAALQQTAATGPIDMAEAERVLLCAESSAHFDEMLGVQSLQSLQPILRAQVCSFLGRTDEALRLYEKHLVDALRDGLSPIEGLLIADRAWCRFRIGQRGEALRDAAEAEICLGKEGLFVDRAAGYSSLVALYDAVGDASAAYRNETLAGVAWNGHALDQARLIEAMDLAFATATA